MKISINRDVITLAQKQEALEMSKAESEWIDANALKDMAARIICQYYGKETGEYINEVVQLPRLSVTMNHYRMTIWADDMIVTYYHDGPKMAILCFDVIWMNQGQKPEAFLQVFDRTFCGTF